MDTKKKTNIDNKLKNVAKNLRKKNPGIAIVAQKFKMNEKKILVPTKK